MCGRAPGSGSLVDTEHQGAVRRRQIEPNDVADLVHEVRIAGELEGLRAVRLHAEGAPDAQTSCAKGRFPWPSSATNGWRPPASPTCSSVSVRGRPGEAHPTPLDALLQRGGATCRPCARARRWRRHRLVRGRLRRQDHAAAIASARPGCASRNLSSLKTSAATAGPYRVPSRGRVRHTTDGPDYNSKLTRSKHSVPGD